jgi:ABC-type nitrate/sulfonate/bicarbonate transport system permease component
MDLFDVIFGALSPYIFAILKLALAFTLFSHSLKLIRHRLGSSIDNNTYSSLWTVFMGYLLGRGIPVIVGLIDVICTEILAKLPH